MDSAATFRISLTIDDINKVERERGGGFYKKIVEKTGNKQGLLHISYL